MIDAVTGAPASAATEPRLLDRLRTPAALLNAAGIAFVGTALGAARPTSTAPAVALGVVALAAWAVWTVAPAGRPRDAAVATGAVTAAVGTGLGVSALIAPVIVALIVAVADVRHGARALAALIGAAAVAVVAAASAHGMALDDVLPLLAGIAVGALSGLTRRQRRLADDQQRALLEAEVAAERETTRAQLLEARSAAARDVHDVLAHSLGGLVLQLDAIEALLEHGRVEEATTRAVAARGLAGEGLAEARRAVAALREPGASPPARIPDDALGRLLAEHRALGGGVEASGDAGLVGVDGPHREALLAALREALVNVRRHAPGAPAEVRFDRSPHAMAVRVTNPLPPAAVPSPGGGHGLLGLRERFAALGDGSAATARVEDGAFVLTATAVLP